MYFFAAICDIYVLYGMRLKFMRCVLKVCDQIWFMRAFRAVHYFKQCLILGTELMGYKFSVKNRQFCRKSVKRSQNASVKCPILKQSGGSNLQCVCKRGGAEGLGEHQAGCILSPLTAPLEGYQGHNRKLKKLDKLAK